jgi:hypothetical protein
MGSDARHLVPTMNQLTTTLFVLGELFASVNDQMLEEALAAALSEWIL